MALDLGVPNDSHTGGGTDQFNALPTVGYFALPVPVHRRYEVICRGPCSGGVWWAREELNLRPLPCQIQRAISQVEFQGIEEDEIR